MSSTSSSNFAINPEFDLFEPEFDPSEPELDPFLAFEDIQSSMHADLGANASTGINTTENEQLY